MKVELTFLRHASRNRNASDSYGAEIAQPLNPKGYAEARLRRQLLGNPDYGLVLSGPALRVVETTREVAPDKPIIKVDELGYEYTSPRGKLIERVFKECAHQSSLATFYAHEHGAALREHGQIAAKAVRWHVHESGASRVLVVGHGGTGPAMVEQMLSRPEDKKMVRDFTIYECEGYWLWLEDAKVVDFEFIRWLRPVYY